MNTGKVWLVGAGPSDAGLFTLKGKEVLSQAEVVVYDALVGHGVLAMVPPEAKLIDVGKRAGNHTMPQEQINQVLLEEARAGRRVVRLKGGDPFMFGRGGEELELLVEHGIPYEVVPGVTSPISVPAYNGIPVTHRDFTSSLHIITGHKRKGKEYDIDFEALVRTKGTLVFLMGITAMADICEGLIRGGMDPDMPAAVLQKGTTARQRRVVATVGTLKEASDRAKIQTPAIIVVGKVCQLAEQFWWYEKLPLFGCCVLVTRPRTLASSMTKKLRQKGAEVIELPAIRTEAIQDNPALEACVEKLDQYQWILFTSQVGVQVFFDRMKEYQTDIRKLYGVKIGVIGQGTKKALEERGLFADCMPEIFDGQALGQAVAARCAGGEKILIPRAAMGNQEVVDAFRGLDVEITDVPIYDTLYETSHLIQERQEFEKGNIDYAVFTSASTVRGFAEATKGMDYSLVNAVCIGKQTKAAADSYGMHTWMAEKATIDSVIEKVEELCRSQRQQAGDIQE